MLTEMVSTLEIKTERIGGETSTENRNNMTHFGIVLVNTKFSFCHNGPFSFYYNLIRPLLH